jgi:hypothetical protein
MRWLVLILLWLTPALGLAQDAAPTPSPDPPAALPPIQTIPPGDDVIAPLRKGQAAPFTGQLFGPNTALRWGNWLQQYKYRLKWDVAAVQNKCTIEINYQSSLLTIEKDRAQKVETDLTTRLGRSEEARLNAEEEARNPPWYSTTAFGVIIGAVATAAVFGIAVAAIDATRP